MAGVAFACLLVFMQLGFHDALFDSATSTARAIRGDIIMFSRQSETTSRTSGLPRARLMQALADPDVARVTPVYLGQVIWKNPETAVRRSIMVLGADPDSGVFALEGASAAAERLRQRDTLLFDAQSRPEYGPIGERLARGATTVEVANRTTEVVGLFRLGASFAADGNLLTSDVNFHRLVRDRIPDMVDVGAVFLKAGADVSAVKARLQRLLPDDVRVMTHDEFIANERAYWANSAAIGFIFLFGVGMGLIVGFVIVYQILFTDVANHLSEYATLKAMGYTDGYFLKVVFSEALMLAVLGFMPGFALSWWLFGVSADATFLPMLLRPDMAAFVFALIFTMCAASGAVAVRKLRDANPADMF
ncbi:ABC transporter permease DevC [Rhabdaerophilum sp.]|uniref:ABC transporter permease DevC n=1 Tax=Rhabdaerophilum sp. TaxID=2717341 RepID=UPI0038D476DB